MAGKHRSRYIVFAPGVKFRNSPDLENEKDYIGTAEALIAAGVIDAALVPGAPGRLKSISFGVWKGYEFHARKNYGTGNIEVSKRPAGSPIVTIAKPPKAAPPVSDIRLNASQVGQESDLSRDEREFVFLIRFAPPSYRAILLESLRLSYKEELAIRRKPNNVVNFSAYLQRDHV